MPPPEEVALRPVAFLDLGRSTRALKAAILDDVSALLESGSLTNGAPVQAFEERFAEFCGVGECVGVASGLDALRLALIALGIGRGDEVLVPAMTFVATFEAVTQAGATPVVVDISPADYGMDAAAASAAITPHTRAILPVHLYGQMADVLALATVADRHGLALVEDACQAHGARRDGVRAGSPGAAAAFSFYPAKNLGALGDAGAVLTDDGELAGRLRALREHGQRVKHVHEFEGYTARLDTVHAVVLLHKLALLETWNDSRRRIAAGYRAQLEEVGDLVLPPVPAGSEPVWHIFAIRTATPDALAAFLAARGIATARHYPTPPHLTPAYETLAYGPGMFPSAESLAREQLSLPIFPGMTDAEIEAVIGAIRDYFDRR